MSPAIILGILLAISVAGNALLAKLYVGAREDVARITQAFNSFKAQVKVEGETAQKKAAATEMADKLKKDTADAENAATVARLNADIGKLRRDRDRARGSIVPPAPAGSGCPPEQACFDRAGLELALRDFVAGTRGLADQAAAVEADLNTAKRWAQATP